MVKVKGGLMALGAGSGRGDPPLLAGTVEGCPSCKGNHLFPLASSFTLRDTAEVVLPCGLRVQFQANVDGRGA